MRFKFLGVGITIEPMFWLFLLFFTRLYRELSFEGLLAGGVLFLSLLVHEYGHAAVAFLFGERPEIVLEAFGGHTAYLGRRITPFQDFLITLGGPLLECVLIASSYLLLQMPELSDGYYVRYVLVLMVRLNLLWVGLNLLPIEPLDGGRMARFLLEKLSPFQGERMSIYLGILTALVLAPLLFFKGLFFFASLLLIFGVQNFQRLSWHTPKRTPFSLYNEALEAARCEEREKAKRLLKRLLRTKESSLRARASEALAQLFHSSGDGESAYALLLKVPPSHLLQGKRLLAELAYERGHYRQVLALSHALYEQDPVVEIALMNARAAAHLKNLPLAEGWLHTASLFGTLDMDAVLADPLFHNLRSALALHQP